MIRFYRQKGRTLTPLRRPVGRTVLALLLAMGTLSADEPTYYPHCTVKRFQLTGDFDRPRRTATLSRTAELAGVVATDLGSSFEHSGKLYVRFGDTWGRPGARDALAWTESESADSLRLEFFTDEEGKFLPIEAPGIGQGGFEVPSYGISIDGRIYVVFTTDHSKDRVMGRSVLAVSDNDGRSFRVLHDLSTNHFINVAMAPARDEEEEHLPGQRSILIWGSGSYRQSSVRLACVPSGKMGERSAIRYFARVDKGRPLWAADERESCDLFHHPVVGEFSVAWIARIGRWVMLYNSTRPRGIVMRTAKRPWGSWSEPTVIFEPWRDMGYSQFMHVSREHERMDAFHDPGRHNTWGGEYGPYLIPRFTAGDSRRCTIFYTMSTWNPYQVVVMSSDIGSRDGAEKPAKRKEQTLPGDARWTTSGPFLRSFERKGIPHVTSFAGKGDRDQGVAHWGFAATEEGSISFTIHGGEGELVLVRDEEPPPAKIADVALFYDALKAGVHGPVVEAIAGPGTNDEDVKVRWSLHRHRGKKIRLYLIDKLTGPWGFVSVSEIIVVRR